ncbi:MAG TPA: cupin domain-containing protein [Steroidobacteraceae bacterium]|jgi:quercetin dioxygenase-like cupin family protein|nr:cupin domain-containing protein [Steroidobacteraceae bacterium]
MFHYIKKSRAGYLVALAAALVAPVAISADGPFASLDPKAIAIRLPADMQWKSGGLSGAESIALAGDASKPGLYVVLVKWSAHHNSRPHFHPNDRFITVLSGTWWVSTGRNYDPEHMKPVPQGSFVTHYAGEVHYDGAKDADVILEIVGMGPETLIPAEGK